MEREELLEVIQKSGYEKKLVEIAEMILSGERISPPQGILLFEKASLGLAGILADFVNGQKNAGKVYYNKNFHIEPTNICLYNCEFCSYAAKNSKDQWELTPNDIINKVRDMKPASPTEVHIVGGVHPERGLHYYGKILQAIKKEIPGIHIKAFTAIELFYMIKKSGLEIKKGLEILKDYGLESLPGGGAEIFAPQIRKKICPKKPKGDIWLEVHQKAHEVGLPSNATILYGHIENYEHRIQHLEKIRTLQDKTKGFNAFIPLKYKHINNALGYINEVSIIEDLKNYAITRIFLDNINHIKAYWPMIGRDIAQLSLSFGVDDLDGTINDSTKIYSSAGAEEKNPAITTQEIRGLVIQAKKIPVERDSLYNILK